MASYFEAVAPTAPTRATIAGRFEAISSSMIASIMVWFVSKGQEISDENCGILKSKSLFASNTQKNNDLFPDFCPKGLKNKGTIHTSYWLFLHNKVPLFFWFDLF